MRDTVVYLEWDRYTAMLNFILGHAGTLEVPYSFTVPHAKELPADYMWPTRQIVSTLDGMVT